MINKLFIKNSKFLFFSINEYPQPYCDIVESMPLACLEISILELFGHDGEYSEATDTEIDFLTDEQVLDAINSRNTSGIFLDQANYTSYLSEITYDNVGLISGARATNIVWLGKMDMEEAKSNPAPNRGEPIDPRMLQWEGDMLDIMLNKSDYPPGLKSYPNVARSFGDIAGETILGDVSLFVVGYMLMFAYASWMLGNFSCIGQRMYLASVGIFGVIMGIISSYGICSFLGIFYGPMHSVMPFLMLGIGIDDMFVIMQCWDTQSAEERQGSLEKRFGFLMRNAGAAITVTSVTDIIAFGIGASTILPALQSFCIYASVGIIATFIFQSSFFLAWMTLDQRRIEANRNSCCPCYVHTGTSYESVTQTGILQTGFRKFAGLIILTPVRVIVIVFTLATTGVGLYGNALLRQEFDPAWFLPQDTYAAQWFSNSKTFFPSAGERGNIYFSGTNLPNDLPKIHQLSIDLENLPDVVSVDSWTKPFISYADKLGYANAFDMNETSFQTSLTQFLYSPVGGAYMNSFKFKADLKCGIPTDELKLSQISYTHR